MSSETIVSEKSSTDSAVEGESETSNQQALYREDADGNPVEGWITDSDGTVGYCQDGYLLTGYQMIDDSRYLFTDDGDMITTTLQTKLSRLSSHGHGRVKQG